MLESQASGLRTPENLISPVPSPAPQSISVEINTATRSVHSRLNKLIVTRLPFALPPHSDNPGLYAIGISRFAQIYLTFEARWQESMKQGKPSLPAREEKMHEWLADLVPSGLWRTQAIKSDLHHLNNVLDIKLEGADASLSRDQALIDHIRTVTAEKPHTYIAYAWIMYMAIFSGGRWIRQQMLEAGPSFWHVEDDGSRLSTFRNPRHPVPGFSLFYFDGDKDGEDIKADFKNRLEMAEELLSAKQRKEVCKEAQFIFDACIRLVEKLDEELATPAKPSASDQDAALAKAKASHAFTRPVPPNKRNPFGSSRALGAVLFALFFWYAWIWTKN